MVELVDHAVALSMRWVQRPPRSSDMTRVTDRGQRSASATRHLYRGGHAERSTHAASPWRGLLWSRSSKYLISTSSTTSQALSALNSFLTSSEPRIAKHSSRSSNDLDARQIEVT